MWRQGMELHLYVGDFKLSLVADKFERTEPVEYPDSQSQSVGFQPRPKELANEPTPAIEEAT